MFDEDEIDGYDWYEYPCGYKKSNDFEEDDDEPWGCPEASGEFPFNANELNEMGYTNHSIQLAKELEAKLTYTLTLDELDEIIQSYFRELSHYQDKERIKDTNIKTPSGEVFLIIDNKRTLCDVSRVKRNWDYPAAGNYWVSPKNGSGIIILGPKDPEKVAKQKVIDYSKKYEIEQEKKKEQISKQTWVKNTYTSLFKRWIRE